MFIKGPTFIGVPFFVPFCRSVKNIARVVRADENFLYIVNGPRSKSSLRLQFRRERVLVCLILLYNAFLKRDIISETNRLHGNNQKNCSSKHSPCLTLSPSRSYSNGVSPLFTESTIRNSRC